MTAKTYQPGFLDWVIILIATPLIHLLGLTLRIKEEGQVQLGPRARQKEAPLWALWHETILMSVWYHRDQDVRVMISASRDGELISRIAHFFWLCSGPGFQFPGRQGSFKRTDQPFEGGPSLRDHAGRSPGSAP